MRLWHRLLVFSAQGFGVGWVPVAPGTFGSLLGLGWFALLLLPGNLPFFILGSVTGIALSVWSCGEAERSLGKRDPGSVVLDEIVAMPLCFLTWLAIQFWGGNDFPKAGEVFSGRNWLIVAGVFVAFRFFDVAKPWPVRQSQELPGGWGITVDDLLAAVYVNIVIVLIQTAQRLL